MGAIKCPSGSRQVCTGECIHLYMCRWCWCVLSRLIDYDLIVFGVLIIYSSVYFRWLTVTHCLEGLNADHSLGESNQVSLRV